MKAVIYARYSSDNQREESIEGQIRECMEFAEIKKRCKSHFGKGKHLRRARRRAARIDA